MALKKPKVIERLEEAAKRKIEKPKVWQIEKICQGVSSNKSLQEISKESQLEEEEVFGLCALLGTWLIHSNKTNTVNLEKAIPTQATSIQLKLFDDPTSSSACSGYDIEGKKFYPPGFRKSPGQTRDLGSSLGAILYHKPSKETIIRWVDRAFQDADSNITAKDIYMLWAFSTIGRIEDIDKVSASPGYAKAMLGAWDALETSIENADRALAELLDNSTTLERAQELCTKITWLDQARIARVERCASIEGPRATEFLSKEIEKLKQEVTLQSKWHIKDLSELTDAQMLRLIESLGLLVDEDKATESRIRQKIAETPFAKDVDYLLPAALRAARIGEEEVFWEALKLRSQKDPEWRRPLENLQA